MSRNHLKSFPTAMLRRGMVHFHPAQPAPGAKSIAADPPPAAVESAAPAPRETTPTPTRAGL